MPFIASKWTHATPSALHQQWNQTHGTAAERYTYPWGLSSRSLGMVRPFYMWRADGASHPLEILWKPGGCLGKGLETGVRSRKLAGQIFQQCDGFLLRPTISILPVFFVLVVSKYFIEWQTCGVAHDNSEVSVPTYHVLLSSSPARWCIWKFYSPFH